MMAVQGPIQIVWYKPSTWGFDWRKYVPFWKEDPPTLTSLTGKGKNTQLVIIQLRNRNF